MLVREHDPIERAKEKQASRDQDAQQVESGLKSPREVWLENSWIKCRPEMNLAKIPRL